MLAGLLTGFAFMGCNKSETAEMAELPATEQYNTDDGDTINVLKLVEPLRVPLDWVISKVDGKIQIIIPEGESLVVETAVGQVQIPWYYYIFTLMWCGCTENRVMHSCTGPSYEVGIGTLTYVEFYCDRDENVDGCNGGPCEMYIELRRIQVPPQL